MLDVNVKKVERNKLNIKCTRVVKLCKIGVFFTFFAFAFFPFLKFFIFKRSLEKNFRVLHLPPQNLSLLFYMNEQHLQ